jgi:hypothetical protein
MEASKVEAEMPITAVETRSERRIVDRDKVLREITIALEAFDSMNSVGYRLRERPTTAVRAGHEV